MLKRFASIGLAVIIGVGIASMAAAATKGPLGQIIEGAKREGTVSAKLRSGLMPKSVGRMTTEFKEMFGVDMNIKFTPSNNMPKDLTEVIMEQKVGAIPSYDLITVGPDLAVTAFKAGVVEKVDWSSLIPKEVSPTVIINPSPYGELGLSSYTSQQGLMYNPQKVSAGEAPRTLSALTSPKWKGKLGIQIYQPFWARRAFLLGKEETFSMLRTILKNGAIQGTYSDLYNRFLLNEISMAFVGNSYFKMALDKGVPVVWQNIDFVDEESRPQVVIKGARHPNAAKLLAIYIASPKGAQFMLEESGAGNASYPGNYTYDIRVEGQKQGMKVVYGDRLTDFYASDDFEKWMREIRVILDSGGER